MQTLSEHEFPPGGGWTFRQAQTNWTNPMAMVGFKASVDAIIKHRLVNKIVAAKHGLSTERGAVAAELMRYTRARLGIAEPVPSVSPGFFRGSSSPVSRIAGVAADIKRAAQGTAVPLDWIQAGGDPEAQELAEKRAAVCVACPKNVPGAWYTTAPAKLLREAVEGWQALKGRKFEFQTSQGDKLKSCDVCKCLMQLKVFVPLKHVVEKTPPNIMAEFPSQCWIAKRDT